MDFAILGELRVSRGGSVLDAGSPLQRALLALLLTDTGATWSDDTLVDVLWPGGTAPANATASLQTYVARLRRVLEPGRAPGSASSVLRRTGVGYRLEVDRERVDAVRFAGLAADAHERLRRGDAAKAHELAGSALGCWRGDVPVPELADRQAVEPFRGRLRELRLTCTQDRLEALIALGRHEEALADLKALTTDHPLREHGWLLLMTALHQSGRTAEALQAFSQVRRLLDDDLGLQPGAALRDLHLAILRDEPTSSAPRVPRSQPGVAAPARGAGPVAASPETSTDRMVGRLPERRALRDVLDGLARSGPRFVLVEGEAGIGKTRLVTDMVSTGERLGFGAAWGRCHPDDDSPALWPWRQVALAGDPAVLSDPGEGMFSVFERVLAQLAAAAGRRPLLLVLDDVHWADAASLRLLAFLTVEMQSLPVAVVVTTRPDAGSEHLRQTRAALARSPGYLHLALAPLDPAETAALVRRVLEDHGHRADDEHAFDAGTLARLHDRSGGNPFFATELARLLADRSQSGGASAALPSAVRDVVRSRLASLPAGADSALRLAAVAGDRFDLGLVLRASSLGDDALADALDAALASGLLVAEGSGYAFAHALVRESLLAETSDVHRRRLHAALAAAGPPSVFERAHHLVHGRPFTDAADTLAACLRAARAAEADRTYEAAADWWGRALAVRDSAPESPVSRPQLLLGLGSALVRAGDSLQAQRHLGECIELCLGDRSTGLAAEAAAVLGTTGGTWFWVQYGTYPRHLLEPMEQLLAMLGHTDSPERAQVLSTLATGVYYGDPARAVALAHEAVAAARLLDDPELLARTLAALSYVLWQPGRDAEIIAVADELLDVATTHRLPFFQLLAHLRRAPSRMALLQVEGADDDVRAAWDLAEQQKLPLLQAQLTQMQAARAILTGELETADALVDRVYVLMERVQVYLRDLTDELMRVFVRMEQGRLAELLPLVQSADREAQVGDEVLLAYTLAAAGRLDDARAVVAERQALRDFPRWWNWLSITCYQVDLAVLLDDQRALESLVDRLLPYADELALYGGIGALGPVTRYLGRAELALGRWAAAEDHLRRGLEAAQQNGFRASESALSLHLGEVLAATGRMQDGAGLVSGAARLAGQLGMRHVARRAASFLTDSSAAGRPVVVGQARPSGSGSAGEPRSLLR